MSDISYVSASTVAATSSSSTSDTDSSTTSSVSEDQEVFLSLLLTQLENQNPLDPVDTTEFTNQLVSYSSLEQQMEMNEKLDTMISSIESSSSLSVFSYIGAEVDVDLSTSVMQSDEAEWTYVLDDDAESVMLEITDGDGSTVSTYEAVDGDAGTYSFTLDNADLSEYLDEGTVLYLNVIATDSNGDSVETSVSSTVTVNSVEAAGDDTTLSAGNFSFTTDNITALRQSEA